MFNLYPSEEIVYEVSSDPVLKVKKRSRYLLVLFVILLAVALFYNYASAQDFVLNAVFWVALFGAFISLVAYIVTVSNAKKKEDKFKYVITNTRIVQVNEEGKVVKEILRNKVKRVDTVNITSNSGSIVINPRELSPQDRYKRELKGEHGTMYTKDTFIISDVKNLEKIIEIIKA